MKKIKLLWTMLLIPTLFLVNSCKKKENKCEGRPLELYEIGFSFRLIDENTGESVIAAWGTKYDHEDIEFKQVMKDTIEGLNIIGNGWIAFSIIDEIGPHNEDEIVGKPFTNTYYLFLDAKNEERETDIDTIIISSEVIPVDRDCISIDFGHTTVVYNDSIYHQGEYLEHIDFIKKH